MAGIDDYSSLVMEACEYSGRNDIMHHFPRFIGLCEAKLNRSLRVADMEKTATISLVDGNSDLPPDYLEAREVLGANGLSINGWSLSGLSDRYRSYGGVPQGYAIVGNVLQARPISTSNLTMTYYAKIPPLSPSAPTNWLLEKAPDVYLYGLCEEIAIWQKDADAAGLSAGMKEQAIKGLKMTDNGARWGNGQVVLGGCTP